MHKMSQKRKQHLFRLVREGHLEKIESFITKNYSDDVWKRETHDKSGDTVTHVAARHGHLLVITWLVETHCLDLGVANHDGKHALHEAAHYGHAECVEYLSRRTGVAVDCLKRADWTPMMLACTKPNLDVIEILIKHGANLRLKNKDGWNCFHIACREGHVDIVHRLLDHDSELWDVSSKNRRTPLHTAALHGQLDVTRFLLERGHYPLDPSDSCGSTPVMDALRGGHLRVAELLIETTGADLLREDAMGRCCLHLAAQVGCHSAVNYLVQDRHMDVNARSSVTGISPLHLAAKEGQHTTIGVLCSLGANVQGVDDRGRTALHQACGGQFAECVRVLLECGAHDVADNYGQKARDIARKSEILTLLDTDDVG